VRQETTRLDKLRIALYSHDTMGIGHMRRNQLIAQALAASALKPNILMICGAREACFFETPPGVDCVTLPSLAKRGDGVYHARRLDVGLGELLRLRSQILKGTLDAFDPDVLIVDKVPRGALCELNPALELLKTRGNAKFVLGLRDVLDDPRIVADEWARDDAERAVRDYYDAVWVYGSRDVYDVAEQYGFSNDVVAKIRYTGYLQRYGAPGDSSSPAGDAPPLRLPAGPVMLCMVGGGQDGGHVAEAFARATLPQRATGVIVTGPFMPTDAHARIRAMARLRRNLRIVEFVPNIDALLRRADRVVAMGGYNTVCELLSMGKPSLVVPRTRPRREQLIRAQNMHARGLLDYLEPDALSPEALTRWLNAGRFNGAAPAPAPDARSRIDFNGLSRLPQMLGELVAAPAAVASVAAPHRGAVHVA
jgi:predicted glycosyltransferase